MRVMGVIDSSLCVTLPLSVIQSVLTPALNDGKRQGVILNPSEGSAIVGRKTGKLSSK